MGEGPTGGQMNHYTFYAERLVAYYFFVFESFFVLLGPGLLFDSGLRVVQSGGGKEIRQNPGEGFAKSIPTSLFSDR